MKNFFSKNKALIPLIALYCLSFNFGGWELALIVGLLHWLIEFIVRHHFRLLLTDTVLKQENCNSYIQIKVPILRILEEDETVDKFFQVPKLSKEKQKIWLNKIKKELDKEEGVTEGHWDVLFHFINTQIWKNKDVFANEYVFDTKDILLPETKSSEEDLQARKIQLRVILANGCVKLQLGPIPEEVSPFQEGLKYQRFITIDEFPLKYFPESGIPSKYLGWDLGLYTHPEGVSRIKTVHEERDRYKVLSNVDELDELQLIKTADYQKLFKELNTEMENWKGKYGFQDLLNKDDSFSLDLFEGQERFIGKYLDISFSNEKKRTIGTNKHLSEHYEHTW